MSKRSSGRMGVTRHWKMSGWWWVMRLTLRLLCVKLLYVGIHSLGLRMGH